jgi:hypothetical protein
VRGCGIFSIEALVTVLAFERPRIYETTILLLFQMSPVVIFHVTLCGKSLIAKLAKKRLFMGVDSQVYFKIWLLCEHLPTANIRAPIRQSA